MNASPSAMAHDSASQPQQGARAAVTKEVSLRHGPSSGHMPRSQTQLFPTSLLVYLLIKLRIRQIPAIHNLQLQLFNPNPLQHPNLQNHMLAQEETLHHIPIPQLPTYSQPNPEAKQKQKSKQECPPHPKKSKKKKKTQKQTFKAQASHPSQCPRNSNPKLDPHVPQAKWSYVRVANR